MTPSDPVAPLKFRKKPVVIEAMQFDGMAQRTHEILEWAHKGLAPQANAIIVVDGWVLRIRTLEGEMIAHDGDWIIRGVKGEFYPCKPDIFEATYEPA